LIYPLVLVPLAVLCCSNATNFLAGFNGLEAGMGIVLHISLGVFALVSNKLAAAALALVFAAALVSFLKYNWYPGKVFPGDLNYTIGAVAACVTVLGNMEKFAILCFIPWIIEAVLKALSGFKAETFGILQEDGIVKPRDPKIRSLTHIVMRAGRFTEKQVTMALIGLEVTICMLAFAIIHFM
jgi:UDP-N-acetylglucosamine--dolichyl-phosphate N-acetylglucosaminephosphotransferase